jgi:hypothetical protein
VALIALADVNLNTFNYCLLYHHDRDALNTPASNPHVATSYTVPDKPPVAGHDIPTSHFLHYAKYFSTNKVHETVIAYYLEHLLLILD